MNTTVIPSSSVAVELRIQQLNVTGNDGRAHTFFRENSGRAMSCLSTPGQYEVPPYNYSDPAYLRLHSHLSTIPRSPEGRTRTCRFHGVIGALLILSSSHASIR